MREVWCKAVGVLLAAGVMGMAMAQTPVAGVRQGENWVAMQRWMNQAHQRVLRQLDLSQTQLNQVRRLDADRSTKMIRIRTQARSAQARPALLRLQARQVRQNYRAGLVRILGPEKAQRYRDLIAEEFRTLRQRLRTGSGQPANPARTRLRA